MRKRHSLCEVNGPGIPIRFYYYDLVQDLGVRVELSEECEEVVCVWTSHISSEINDQMGDGSHES